jgi:hypothetical protein
LVIVPAGYDYVDTAMNGARNRNRLMRREDFRPPAGAADAFTTFCRFTVDLARYAEKNPSPTTGKPPSVARYPGRAFAPFLPFDFDCAADPGRAIADSVMFLERLHRACGLNLDCVRISWSGKKGVSLEIPAELFGGFKPSADIGRRLKRLAARLLAGAATADLAIYEKLRLWRAANTRHSGTGLYKIPLTWEELRRGDLDAIRALARSPRTLPAPSAPAVCPALVAIWREVRVAIWREQRRAVARPAGAPPSLPGPHGRVSAEFLFRRAVQRAVPGNRNNAGFWLACQLRDNGYARGEAEEILRLYAARVSSI